MPRAARPDPYTDTSITYRGPYSQSVTNPLPAVTDEPAQKRTTVYEGEGTDVGHENVGVEPPPHSPTGWKPGRDPYATGGGAGQPFLDNQS